MEPSTELADNFVIYRDFNRLIASICLSHGEPLLTGNTKHFSKVPGLALEVY